MILTERRPKETGRDYALRTIKDNIIRMELAPGTSISENELAAVMGLSRTPVRESLIELANVKIIEIIPQKKSVVAAIDYDMVEQARYMRCVLEQDVMRLVCEMAGEEDICRLSENIRLQRFYYENGYDDLMELDDEFHALIYAIAKKAQIYQMMKNFSIHFDRLRHMALISVKNNKIVSDHEAILEAIKSKDPRLACSLAEKHLLRYKIDADAIRETYPQYFHADRSAP